MEGWIRPTGLVFATCALDPVCTPALGTMYRWGPVSQMLTCCRALWLQAHVLKSQEEFGGQRRQVGFPHRKSMMKVRVKSSSAPSASGPVPQSASTLFNLCVNYAASLCLSFSIYEMGR